MDRQATNSYWEVEDYGQLTKLLRSHGVAIRFLKRGRDYHIYSINGLEMHVYRNLRPLSRYRIEIECARAVNSWKEKKRCLWLSIYTNNASIQPFTNADAGVTAFSHNGHVHAVTHDTSVAGFVRLVILLSRMLHGVLEGAPNTSSAVTRGAAGVGRYLKHPYF